jgi:hypothetical protein
LIYFGKFSLKIWPFSSIEDLAFFETAYGQIWPFYFLGPGNPELNFERLKMVLRNKEKCSRKKRDVRKTAAISCCVQKTTASTVVCF